MTWAREGDENAYREMERRYGPPVFDLIYQMVGQREQAEDLTQETFVKAFRALDRHGPERKPSAWILRIANNTAIDYVRRKRPDSTRSHLTMTPGQIDRRAMRMPTLRRCPTPLLHTRRCRTRITSSDIVFHRPKSHPSSHLRQKVQPPSSIRVRARSTGHRRPSGPEPSTRTRVSRRGVAS